MKPFLFVLYLFQAAHADPLYADVNTLTQAMKKDLTFVKVYFEDKIIRHCVFQNSEMIWDIKYCVSVPKAETNNYYRTCCLVAGEITLANGTQVEYHFEKDFTNSEWKDLSKVEHIENHRSHRFYFNINKKIAKKIPHPLPLNLFFHPTLLYFEKVLSPEKYDEYFCSLKTTNSCLYSYRFVNSSLDSLKEADFKALGMSLQTLQDEQSKIIKAATPILTDFDSDLWTTLVNRTYELKKIGWSKK